MVSSGAALQIPASMVAEILAHAQDGYPEEVCGIIAGKGCQAVALHRGRNVSTTPHTSYELDLDTLAMQIDFEAGGLELVGIYHSHPNGPELPSVTDIARAYYPYAVYIICSLADRENPSVLGFRITEGKLEQAPLKAA